MPLYEHVFLARQDISTQQVEAIIKQFSDVITEGGGKIAKTEYWGLKSLAFKIKKSRKAHYALMNIEAPPAAVAEMERRMGLSTDVIRFMTVKVESHEAEPSAQMRKSDRDERGGERGERGGFRGGREGGGGFRGGREGGGGGGFRGGREGGGGGGGGGFRGPREGGEREGSTFRARPPRDGAPREGGGGYGDRGPRPPRPPRDGNPGSGSGSEG